MPTMKGAVIVLAAGKSGRMGKPKQLLPYKGKTLAAHAIETALNSGIGPVVVVSGAVSLEELIGKSIKEGLANKPETRSYYKDRNSAIQPLIWVRNEKWEEGIAGSIRTGLNHVLELEVQSEAVLIMVADQPHVDADLLKRLWHLWEGNEQSMAACVYEENVGTPAVFSKKRFPELQALSGDSGAKKILLAHPDDLATLIFPAGAVDIDTPEDYEKLKQ